MYIPFQYQVSEFDCVPISFINAVSCLFQRNEIPPMVIRHIYMYSLDTVGNDARLGSEGTSKYAVKLLGAWLNSYKLKKFSVKTQFLAGEAVSFSKSKKIINCLKKGGVALCKIYIYRHQEHYVLIMKVDEGWAICFDPYYRKTISGLSKRVHMIKSDEIRSPNLKISIEWIEKDEESVRFCLGPTDKRETLLMWRD